MMTSVRDVSGRWNFVPQSVGLYAHAMAWKGGRIVGLRGDDTQAVIGADQDTVVDLISDYLLDGRVAVRVKDDAGVLSLAKAIESETAYEVLTPNDSPRDEPGRSVFETATANHENTLKMIELLKLGPNPHAEFMLKVMRNDVLRSFSLPEWLYDKDQVAAAGMDAVIHALDMFRIMVNSYRDGFARSVCCALEDWLVSQEPPIRHATLFWYAKQSGKTGIEGLDAVYWAFRECGLPLTQFGREFPAWLRSTNEAIPMREFREALQSWEGMRL